MRIRFEDKDSNYIAQIDEGGVSPIIGDRIRITAHKNAPEYYEVVEKIFSYDVGTDNTNLVVKGWHLLIIVKPL